MSLSSDLCGVQAHNLGDHTVIRFTGPRVLLDEDNIVPVGEQLLALAGRLTPVWLLVDFGNVNYLTTTALGVLLRLRKALDAWGGRLTLRNLHPWVYEVFEVTKLHTLFDIQSEAAGSSAGLGLRP
jgi:anti-sigma B factor antagonist